MTRYLVRKTGEDGVTRMVEVTKEGWLEVVATNAGKPDAEKRKFFPDMIVENGDVDCLVMEVPAQTIRGWNAKAQAVRRNLKDQRQFEVISLDNYLDEQTGLTYRDTLPIDVRFEEMIEGQLFVEKLRKVLVQWKFWGPVLLDFYLAGKRRSCTHEFAEMLGISEQMARVYKREFEKFVIDYTSKHSGLRIAA